MKTIQIDIAPDGAVKIETKGYAGATCKDGSRFLEIALGTKTAETLTAEHFTTAQQQQQQGAG